VPLRDGGGSLHFFTMRTEALERAPLEGGEAAGEILPGERSRRALRVSGGGAYKLEAQIKRVFRVEAVERVDELRALVDGLRFVASQSAREDEVFSCANARFADVVGAERERLETRAEPLFREPFVLVNVGSGVSFVDCDLATGTCARVGGSSIGGGTFHGLVSLLTGENDFDRAIEEASRGDSTKVDLLVGDIYGDAGATSLSLRASILASSFGRVATSRAARERVTHGDLALALLMMLGLNLSAMACLHARLLGRKTIFFTGNFFGVSDLHRRPFNLAVRVFAYGVSFWSGDAVRALFLRAYGDLGSVGTIYGAAKPAEGGSGSAPARL